MANLSIPNVCIAGIAATVPADIEKNSDFFSDNTTLNKFVATTGVEERRKANKNTCASDLCLVSAEKLIKDLEWNKSDIEALIFVSQTPDYKLPSTAPIIQDKLGLSIDCYTLDISLGCSGWVYGMSVLSSLMQNGSIKKGLLLVGDTLSKFCSDKDVSTYPLFGDSGTATALEYKVGASGLKCDMHTNGSDYRAIIIEDGAFRNPVSPESFKRKKRGEGVFSSDLELELDGMTVFSFGLNKAPKSVNALCERYSIDKNTIDYFTFHQANFFMNEKIRKKLKISEEKVPYSLKYFGNTSCASIPLTMVYKLQNELSNRQLKHIACGFGVGLSWGSIYFETNNIVIPDLIEL